MPNTYRLKQCIFFLSNSCWGQKCKMGPSYNSDVGRAVFPSGNSQEESFLLPIWPLDAACILGLMAPPVSNPAKLTSCCFHVASFWLSLFSPFFFFLFPPSFLLKDPSKYIACVKVTQLCPTLWEPHGLFSPWNSPGQNTGVGSLSLLQGIFPTQGSNPGLPHCRGILYQLSHKGCPIILAWVAYPFSSRSSHPRNWTRVSCIAGWFFTNWAIREALIM